MNRIDQLTQQLCPDGVPYRPLSEIGETVSGLTGKSKADFSDGNARYVSYMNAFSNLSVDQKAADFVKIKHGERQNKLRRGDIIFTGSSESREEVGMSSVVVEDPIDPLYLNSFCFAVRFGDAALFDPEFSKHLFRSKPIRKAIEGSASGVTRINVSKQRFMKVRVPCPPLELQQEIAGILDTFSKLEARRVQYTFYRDQLLKLSIETPRRQLGDIALIGTGSHDTKDAIADGEYVFYARGREPLRLDSYDYDEQAIITAGDGVGVGKVFHFASGKYALHQRAYRIVPGECIDARFLYHYLVNNFGQYLQQISVHASVTSLRRPMFMKFPVAVPSLDEQRRIAVILDGFDTLATDLSIGLPAELNARRQQYEHYRDRLLTFQEATV